MAKNTQDKVTRLAIVNPELCKPKECASECKKACPVNKTGRDCITISQKAAISEILCIGCSACQKKCPFKAITIVNLPTDLNKEISHRYSANGFKLHRLPVPKPGKVLGLVGTNGIGKSTALKILSGQLKPNLGDFDSTPDWARILNNYKGSELHGFFTKILEGQIKAISKIQYIDRMPKYLKKKYSSTVEIALEKSSETAQKLTVREVLQKADERNKMDYYVNKLCLTKILERDLEDLSGGELQRFTIAYTCVQNGDVYIFDEPSSYLDVKQRLFAAREIRNLCDDNKFVIVVEHDLAILDLMCDYGCVLYGQSGAYGVISVPYTIKAAINIFLDGHIPSENMRFRTSELKFNIAQTLDSTVSTRDQFYYPALKKTYKNFELNVASGYFSESEIVVFLGENGMGKTTLVGMIAGLVKPDNEEEFTKLTYSLKPQKILPKFKGTVRDLFMSKIRSSFTNDTFQNEVIKPMNIHYLYDQPVANLSGGELQRIAIAICLGKEANIYLLDEPSAFLDSDQRIIISKVIKRYIYGRKKCAFIVEHDLIVGTYLADKVIVFEGEPGVRSTAHEPMDLQTGMNVFLKNLDVTFRRDSSNYRPRVNKPGSAKDKTQKDENKYFF
ncbi:Translation initiation factor RLI1 [Nosema granulosis]|uniref:Translation initiation factor RLI1 n=1 Tax=Nosema granulosis TaxID=83296 RepID=A0A9P6H437_9MICR|nr:Translation initiation factor RLI1 [Nosema granulosis]